VPVYRVAPGGRRACLGRIARSPLCALPLCFPLEAPCCLLILPLILHALWCAGELLLAAARKRFGCLGEKMLHLVPSLPGSIMHHDGIAHLKRRGNAAQKSKSKCGYVHKPPPWWVLWSSSWSLATGSTSICNCTTAPSHSHSHFLYSPLAPLRMLLCRS
jgi:hypothetical protein